MLFKTPVTIANAGCRKWLPQKLGSGKPATFFLHTWCCIPTPTGRGNRPVPPPGFSVSRFSRKFSDLGSPIFRAPSIILLILQLLRPYYAVTTQLKQLQLQRSAVTDIYISVVHSSSSLGYLMHISIITPVVSASKNHYM